MNLIDFVCEYQGCKLIYENPITLPCGNSLCKQHLNQQNEKFKCTFCLEEHQIPDTEFPINKAMIKMIDSHIQLDPLRKKVKESFDNLNESIREYQDVKSDDYIYNYFAEIRNKVDLHREELKKEVDDRSDEIIKTLKTKEEKCKLNASKLEQNYFEALEIDRITAWKQKFRIPIVNRDDLNDLLSKMKEHVKQMQNETLKYKNGLLLNEQIEFEKFEKSSLFGELKITRNVNFVLSKKCGELIKSYNKHSKTIRSLQVDEKSNKLISASTDKTIRIWNLTTGDCLKTLYDHKDWINSLLIIPNDRFISGSDDRTIKIWDLNSYKCIKTLANGMGVFSLCLISNNKIAVGCDDGSIGIWNLDSFKREKLFQAHNEWITHLILVDNSKLVSCSADKKIKIWSLNKLEFIRELEGHSSRTHFLESTSDGHLLSCSDDKTVKLWRLETGELLKSVDFDSPVNCVKVLNDNLISVALDGGEIKICNSKLDKIKTISAHSSYVYRLHLVSNVNLLSGSAGGEIKLWKMLE